MRYFLYVSRPSSMMTTDAVTDLLSQARHNNIEKRITGVLLHQDGYFVQYFEGPDDTTHELIEKVKIDARHDGFVILDSGDVEARLFEDWSMGFEDSSSWSAAFVRHLDKHLVDPQKSAMKTPLTILKNFHLAANKQPIAG